MRTTKKEIEKYAIQAVIKFEKKNGWNAKNISSRSIKEYQGFDVLSKKNGDEKYIEVKSGSADVIWTNVEVYTTAESLLKNRKLWIYCVLNVAEAKAKNNLELTKIYITKPEKISWEPITKFKIKGLSKNLEKWR